MSFQHQATRMQGERESLRRARAWAVWALIREAKPSLPGDPDQGIIEPTVSQIEAALVQFGHREEARSWREFLRLVERRP